MLRRQLVQLTHSSRNAGLILKSCVAIVDFAHIPCDRMLRIGQRIKEELMDEREQGVVYREIQLWQIE